MKFRDRVDAEDIRRRKRFGLIGSYFAAIRVVVEFSDSSALIFGFVAITTVAIEIWATVYLIRLWKLSDQEVLVRSKRKFDWRW
jgi:hypothetical protein